MSDDQQREESFGEQSPVVDLVVGPGEEDNSRFGELLERLRWKAGLSRSDAASELGFSSEYLRLIEIGKRTPALGQMRNFLATYGAEGDVEKVSPQGYRQDLLIFDPLHGDEADPTIVEFKSRIREARRSRSGAPDGDYSQSRSVGERQVYGRLSASRAAEIGLVVSLLTNADDETLQRIRALLEDAIEN